MSVDENALRARNLRTLGLLAGLFLLPLALSFWMYYGTGWRPAGRSNHGELIMPARPLPPPAGSPDASGKPLLRGKWSLVYVGDGACGADCRQALYVMRQTRLSLNNDMTRVERVFLATGHCCANEFLAAEHPGLRIVDASAAGELLQSFPLPPDAAVLYVVDPLGNLLMSYATHQNPKGLLQDLKKLLSLSHIG